MTLLLTFSQVKDFQELKLREKMHIDVTSDPKISDVSKKK